MKIKNTNIAMEMKSKLILGTAMLMVITTGCSKKEVEAEALTQYVDMRIGTGDHGHVFMGASVPFGMVQVGPTSVPQGWDWCSGYHESDSTVIGFSQTHLSGTGIGDLFDITLMPVIGEVTYSRGDSIEGSGLWSYADRSKEVSRPGYYRVPLTRYGIDAEMTATTRAGLHRFTFPASEEAAVVFDLQNGGSWDRPTETCIDSVSPTRVEGYRYSSGWARDQRVYFVAEFSKPMASLTRHGQDGMYGRVNFSTEKDEPIMVKVGISPTSIEGASKNLAQEIPGWDFEGVEQQALQQWEKALAKIKIQTPDEATKKKFYTALYHTMLQPFTFCDVDGMYRGADGEAHKAEGFTPYTVFSLWDTYRAAMPLYTLIESERYADFINTFLDIADQQGRLPVWHLWGNETNCMVGNPGVIAVGDAINKDIPGFDRQRALEAMTKTMADPGRGGRVRNEVGFIPSDSLRRSVATDEEYAIADACVASAARTLGNSQLADSFTVRSHSYRNYFDPSTGFMRGKLSNGSWRTPFDPGKSNHEVTDYCEGNAWQYIWLAPHDVEGLVELFGSRDALLAKLDSTFTVEYVAAEGSSPDISGCIGQYAHGNEPSHSTIYLYSMLGEPEKAAEHLRYVMDKLYTTEPAGLCGNEDAGQMSAWYVLSAIGLYQANPAEPVYWIGSPVIDRAEIAIPSGIFTVRVEGNSPEARAVKRATLNGAELTTPYLPHSSITPGGELVLYMK